MWRSNHVNFAVCNMLLRKFSFTCLLCNYLCFILEPSEPTNAAGITLRNHKCLAESQNDLLDNSNKTETTDKDIATSKLEVQRSTTSLLNGISKKKIARNAACVATRSSSRLKRTSETQDEQEKDVYEFEDEDAKLDSLRLRKTKLYSENVIQSDLTDGISKNNEEVKAETNTAVEFSPKSGRLKLTLRMKRSPILDEVIESGNSLSEDSFEPEYEVLRVEGVESFTHRKRRHKSKERKRERRLKHIESLAERPPTKRLKLIFGNESHTIDLPSTSSN